MSLEETVSEGDVVILIHGTFARDAKWIESNSEMSKALCERFPTVRVEAFRWSGRNSHMARISAGEALAGRIDDISKSLKTGAGIHLIGHSHGGNVALYAVDRSKRGDRIKGMAFLGTPFLEVELRSVETDIAFWSSVIAGLCALAVAVTWMYWIISKESVLKLGNLISEWVPTLAWESDDGSRAGVGYIVISGIAILAGLAVTAGKTWIDTKFAARLVQNAKRFLESIQQLPPKGRTFIAVTQGDEARLWLKGGSYAATLPNLLLATLHTTAEPVFFTSLVWTGALFWLQDFFPLQVTSQGYEQDPLGTGRIFLLAITAMVLLPLLITVGHVFFRGNPAAFGWESPFSAFACGLRPAATPQWTKKGKAVLYRANGAGAKGLRHSIFYEDVRTITALIDWLEGKLINDAVEIRENGSEARPPWHISSTSLIAIALTSLYFMANAAVTLRFDETKAQPAAPAESAQSESKPEVQPTGTLNKPITREDLTRASRFRDKEISPKHQNSN